MKGQVVGLSVIGMLLVTLIANIMNGQIAVSVQNPYNNVYWCYDNDTTMLGNLTHLSLNNGTKNISCNPKWVKIDVQQIKQNDKNKTSTYREYGYVTDTDGRDWRCTGFYKDALCYFGTLNSTYGLIKVGI